jgi:hypothetical protein
MVARVRTKVRGMANTAAEAAVVEGAEEAVGRTTGAAAVRGPTGTIARR